MTELERIRDLLIAARQIGVNAALPDILLYLISMAIAEVDYELDGSDSEAQV